MNSIDEHACASTKETCFDTAAIGHELSRLSPAELDQLDFGVIGFDEQTLVRLYNKQESEAAGLTRDRVIDRPLFTLVAPCMNNFMVAQRFEDAAESGCALDETIDYVLTLKMRPVKVKLRLIAEAGAATRYVLVDRI